jgi:hypothetical protein
MLVGDEVTVSRKAGIRAKALSPFTVAAQYRNLTGLPPIFQPHHDSEVLSIDFMLPMRPRHCDLPLENRNIR